MSSFYLPKCLDNKMRVLFTLQLLVVLVAGSLYSYERDDESDKTVVTPEYYPENLVIYEGKHDIVDIMVPLNSLSDHDSSESYSSELSYLKEYIMIFFIEADLNDGHREDHGIYVYRNGKATKVMDKGRAVTASADDSEYVFFGAKDGLYIYNPMTQKAEKYGNFNDSIKDMAKEQNTDVIYILTDDRELYKVYDAATKRVKIDDVKDAEQIIMDYSNNLYYYGKDNKPYVITTNGERKEIRGLPEGVKEVKLFRPPLFNSEEVAFMVDNEMYTIHSDGSSAPDNLEFIPEAKPTAYSMETGIFRYFGYKKKIYEYDMISMIDSSESESASKSDSVSHYKFNSKSQSRSSSESYSKSSSESYSKSKYESHSSSESKE